jgi:hypothetical protein
MQHTQRTSGAGKRAGTRGLTILAALALLACVSSADGVSVRRDHGVLGRLALASSGDIVGFLACVSVHLGETPRPVAWQRCESVRGESSPAVAPAASEWAELGLLDLPPPAA